MSIAFESIGSMNTSTVAAAHRRQADRWMRALFVITAAWGAAYFWIAAHPPMTDLPQHAGQVALLKAFVEGDSPWRDRILVNLTTPYLLGYGLALPLSLFMPVAAALKLILSVAYIGFVATCVGLRRHFGADPRLDWLALPSFLGFATQWGFFTFVVSSPVALLFIWMSDRFGKVSNLRNAAAVVVIGLVLLASHGLMFVFGWVIGAVLVFNRYWRRPRLTALWRLAVPYALVGLAAVALFMIGRHLQVNVALGAQQKAQVDWDEYLMRVPKTVLAFSAGNERDIVSIIAVAALLCAPFLLGLRIDWRASHRWLPLACVLVFLAVAPGNAFDIFFIYQRFALFLLPAWAWAWTPRDGLSPTTPRRLAAAYVAMAAGTWTLIGMHSVQSWRFDREEADFRRVLAAAEPGQRALALVFDRDSPAAGNTNVYLHQPLWYQAEKNGLVDFNFAWFSPQIARFAVGYAPPVQEGFAWHPESFDWIANRGIDYRYFFVRSGPDMPANLFAGAKCGVSTRAHSGQWTLFERAAC